MWPGVGTQPQVTLAVPALLLSHLIPMRFPDDTVVQGFIVYKTPPCILVVLLNTS